MWEEGGHWKDKKDIMREERTGMMDYRRREQRKKEGGRSKEEGRRKGRESKGRMLEGQGRKEEGPRG